MDIFDHVYYANRKVLLFTVVANSRRVLSWFLGKKTSVSTKAIPRLPNDIHYQILSYLPLWALFDARSVNRWYSASCRDHIAKILKRIVIELTLNSIPSVGSKAIYCKGYPLFKMGDRILSWVSEDIQDFSAEVSSFTQPAVSIEIYQEGFVWIPFQFQSKPTSHSEN